METEYSAPKFHPSVAKTEVLSSNKHEAMGNEWLETGNCPIAKSFDCFAKTMPQPLYSKMPVIGALVRLTVVHDAVPFIEMLRKSVVMPKTAMALTIVASILGQVIGSRAERLQMKAKVNNNKAYRV
ncbi:uncharacterized protein LOC107022436 [Solanum pennellii]|uniref:Uncharacterized protein LOC107022436 n=1 Tax=Solanum pennellii TaxID=28526 RepID=A0ABM1VDE0_SOLPN|nr:uncharacterized protein LOC107022436 [Solanum pennellii]